MRTGGVFLSDDIVRRPPRRADAGRLGTLCRLGLATRGDTSLEREDVEEAIRRGVNYLNWCGHADGLSRAVRRLGERRRQVKVAVQLHARSAQAAKGELRDLRGELGTTWIDAVTYYYVEHPDEWHEIVGRGGAAAVVEAERRAETVGAIGVTSHQRPLLAGIAASGRVDLLMARYNAAHVGAELEVFPAARAAGIPVVTFTGLRWGALLEPMPEDPPGYVPARAPEWYRFVLCHPAVAVALMAPNGRAELEENLSLLASWEGLTPERYRELRAHGERVRRHGGTFP